MATIDGVLMGMESEMINCETIKYIILKQLRKDLHITEEIEKEFNDDWQIILVKKSWFSRLFSKLKKNDNDLKDGYSYKLVKFEDE